MSATSSNRRHPRPVLMLTALALVAAGSALADDAAGRWGVGLEGGVMKPMEGEWDYATVDEFAAVRVRRGLDSHWSLSLGYLRGHFRPGAQFPGDPVGWSFGSGAPLVTRIEQTMLELRHRFTPGSRLTPVLSLGVGRTSWRVMDLRGADIGLDPDGPVVSGHDTDGEAAELSGRHWTFGVGLAAELRLSDSLSLEAGGRYRFLPGLETDNTGTSSLWGPEHVDANTGLGEIYAGIGFGFGSGDGDGDGVPDDRDACPDVPEDLDGFNDLDGCPEEDNDGDGLLDAEDACPNLAEDFDGFEDTDGCPDRDNDGDGIPDGRDRCPDTPEDFDGDADRDGCPDLDTDGDGVPDDRDLCPGTPADSLVDDDGCVVEVPTAADTEVHPAPATDGIVLDGVTFASGSARLDPESLVYLEDIAAWLASEPEMRIEVRGHTDSAGDPDLNRRLSLRRAEAVRTALVDMGLSPDTITAVGLGPDHPIADNATPAGRAANRRVEIVQSP